MGFQQLNKNTKFFPKQIAGNPFESQLGVVEFVKILSTDEAVTLYQAVTTEKGLRFRTKLFPKTPYGEFITRNRWHFMSSYELTMERMTFINSLPDLILVQELK